MPAHPPARPLPATASEVRRIQVMSRRMALACLLLIVIVLVLVPLYWASADPSQLAVRVHLVADAVEPGLSAWQRVVGALLTEIPVLLMMRGLWWARKCFIGFAEGELFTNDAVQYLRHFAAATLACAVAAVLVTPLLSVCLTLHNSPGKRFLAIGLGTDHVLTVFFAALVWVMAGVIRHGQALAEENQSFV